MTPAKTTTSHKPRTRRRRTAAAAPPPAPEYPVDAPAPPSPNGLSKGMIIGLAAVGVGILAAIGILIAVLSGGSSATTAAPAAGSSPVTTTPTTIESTPGTTVPPSTVTTVPPSTSPSTTPPAQPAPSSGGGTSVGNGLQVVLPSGWHVDKQTKQRSELSGPTALAVILTGKQDPGTTGPELIQAFMASGELTSIENIQRGSLQTFRPSKPSVASVAAQGYAGTVTTQQGAVQVVGWVYGITRGDGISAVVNVLSIKGSDVNADVSALVGSLIQSM